MKEVIDMKKLCISGIIFSIMIIILGIGYIIFIYSPKSNLVGLQNDKVYFGMSMSSLINIKGKPESISNSAVCEEKDMFFNETLYGVKCKTSYSFLKAFFGQKLYAARVEVPIFNEQQGKDLFNKFNENMNAIYTQKKFHFNDGVKDNWDTSFEMESHFGTNDGATGIDVHIERSKELLTVSIVNLF